MGVFRFFKYIKHIAKRTPYTECKDETALVDASQRICNCVIAIRGNGTDMTTKDGKITSYIFAIWSYALLLLRRGIKPHFIFDNPKTIDRKKVKVKERRDAKEKSQDICDNTDDKNSETFIKNFKRSFKLEKSYIEECQKLLTLMGIPFVIAPEEADSQIAAMSEKWKCPALTNDSDVLPYGAHSMWTEFNGKDKFITIITKQNVLDEYKKMANLILHDLGRKQITEFKHEWLIDLCCFMGTDYDDGIRIKGLPFFSLLKLYVLNNFDGSRMLEYIEDAKKVECKDIKDIEKIIVPPNYLEIWKGARDVYLEAKIIDPDTLSNEIKRPDKEKLLELLCTVNEFDVKTMSSQIDELTKFYEQRNAPIDTRFANFRSYQKKHLNQKSQKYPHPPTYEHKKTFEPQKRYDTFPADTRTHYGNKYYYRYGSYPPAGSAYTRTHPNTTTRGFRTY